MRFEYVCKYCKQPVGSVEQADWTYTDGVQRLGLHHLEPAHQADVLTHSEATNDVRVHTVCEQCEQAVNMHPELLVEGNILQ